MPSIQFGISSYARARGDLPSLPVINMFAEEAPSEKGRVVLQSRPGLADRQADMGTGDVEALFQRDLVLGSALFGVAGGRLYRGTDDLGAIDGTGPVSMAGYENFLFVAAGKSLWGWDGTTLAKIAFPDNADVAKILIAGSRLVAIRKDTGQFYWSDVLGSTIGGLAFATAENQPDRLLDALFVDDILILGGAETIEYWPNTGDDDLPFQPLEGRVIEKGVKATGCMTTIGSTFAWVTNDNQVCVSDADNIISNPGLEEQIEASATCRVFTFLQGGSEFVAVRLDDETQAWSWRSRLFSEFASYGSVNWQARCFAGGVFGCAGGKTASWSSGHVDLGGVLERRIRGGFPIDGGGLQVANVRLRCNVGQTPFLSGDDAEPQVEMRLSGDGGQTWDDWEAVGLGAQGEYREQPEWRACGLASQPGFLAEFRLTAPVDWRVSEVLINEPGGGR